MSDSIKISKLDAARRQLETAIILYFHNYDPISIHTLAAASHEILRTLSSKTGKDCSMFTQVEAEIRDDKQKEFNKLLRGAQNHFKHADHDPDGVLIFDPQISDLYLFDSCMLWQAITQENHAIHMLFKAWFIFHNQGLFKKGSHMISNIISAFPGKYTSNERREFYDNNIGELTKLSKFLPGKKT